MTATERIKEGQAKLAQGLADYLNRPAPADKTDEEYQEELREEQAKLTKLYEAVARQQKVIEGLRQKGQFSLKEISLDQLITAGAQAPSNNAEVEAADRILREINRRVDLQKVEVRNAEARTHLREARELSMEAWQLETEMAQALEEISEKYKRYFQIHRDLIPRLIDRSRQPAFSANHLPRLEYALREYHRHREDYKPETALSDYGI